MAEGVGRPQRPRPRGPGWSKQEEPSRVPASATTSPLRDHAASRPARSPAPHPTSSGLAHTPAMLRPDGPSDRAPASALPTSARGTGTRARAPRARRRAPRDRPTPAAPRPDLRRPSTATRRDEPPRRARTRRTRTPRTLEPRHNRNAPSNNRTVSAASPRRLTACASTTNASKRAASRHPGPTCSTYPGARVTTIPSEPEPSRERNRYTSFCTELAAFGGGSSPHSTSTNRSADTTTFASTNNAARTRRICGLPNSSSPPPLETCSGPKTPNATSAARLAIMRSSHVRPARARGRFGR